MKPAGVVQPPIPPALREVSERERGDPSVLAHVALHLQETLINSMSTHPTQQYSLDGAKRVRDRLDRLRAGSLGASADGTIKSWASVLVMPTNPEGNVSAAEEAILNGIFETHSRGHRPRGEEVGVAWKNLTSRWLVSLRSRETGTHILSGPFWIPWPPTVSAILEFDAAALAARESAAQKDEERNLKGQPFSLSLIVATEEVARAVGLLA